MASFGIKGFHRRDAGVSVRARQSCMGASFLAENRPETAVYAARCEKTLLA